MSITDELMTQQPQPQQVYQTQQPAQQPQQVYQTQQPAQQPQQVYQTQQPAQQPQAVYVQQPYYQTQTVPTAQAVQATAPVPVLKTVPAAISPVTTYLGLDVSAPTFWKGALLGAGVTLLVTNETVQKTVMRGMTKMMTATSSGIEELKEKYEDAKAEVDAEDAGV